MIRLCFAEENLGEEVEKSVAQEPTDCKGYHDRQGGGIDIGRAQRE